MGDGFGNGVIRLENEPKAVFYAGQEISGSVLFELGQPLRFSVLTLTFLGEANVLWTEDQKEEYNGVARHCLVKYISNEEYFKHTEFLAGGEGISKLPAGSRCFPFKYRIPFTAPSSFTEEKGSVSYSITACLVNSDPMVLNEELVKEFRVIRPIDLNVGPPDVKRPIQMDFEEVYGCDCICSPQPMNIRVRLPVSGYCSGQVMPVSVEIDNNSSVEIVEIIFQLLSKTRYRSKQPLAQYIPADQIISTDKFGAILGNSKRILNCDLTVPDIIPLNLESCSIIDISYFFRIKIRLSGCNSDLIDESEIYLGLIPIIGTTDGEYIHPLTHLLPIQPLPNPTKLYEPVEPVNPAFASKPSQNTTYPPQNTPYPSQNTPYLSQNTPYPSQNTPYPPQNTPKTSPYPSSIAPYPTANPHSENKPFTNKTPSVTRSKTAPYPTDAKTDNPKKENYQIGFIVPESVSNTPNKSEVNPPYPLINNMPVVSPPYPVTNKMPSLTSTAEKDLRIYIPPVSPRVEPSAPPPST